MTADDEWKDFARRFAATMPPPASDEAVRQWEQTQARLEYESRLRSADLPPVLAADLQSPDLDRSRHPIPALRESIAAGRRMVLLTGVPGTGKTVAAICVALEHRGAYFIRVSNYLALAQSYQTQWQAEKATLRSALVLDDLGEEADHYRAAVDSLLSGRYNLAPDCITIVTSNLTNREFADAYGERIVSRFRDPRHCAVIPCRAVIRPRRQSK